MDIGEKTWMDIKNLGRFGNEVAGRVSGAEMSICKDIAMRNFQNTVFAVYATEDELGDKPLILQSEDLPYNTDRVSLVKTAKEIKIKWEEDDKQKSILVPMGKDELNKVRDKIASVITKKIPMLFVTHKQLGELNPSLSSIVEIFSDDQTWGFRLLDINVGKKHVTEYPHRPIGVDNFDDDSVTPKGSLFVSTRELKALSMLGEPILQIGWKDGTPLVFKARMLNGETVGMISQQSFEFDETPVKEDEPAKPKKSKKKETKTEPIPQADDVEIEL